MYKKYAEKRAKLVNEAQTFIDEGKSAEAEAKMQEIKDLDEDYEKQAKLQADMEALAKNGRTAPKQMENLGNAGVTPGVNDVSGESTNIGAKDATEPYATETYTNAWAKIMTGKQLSADEDKMFRMVNEAYTHTTENTPILIPETVTKGIWKEIGEMYPYWNDVNKTYVPGKVTIIKKKSSAAAGWYVESVATEDGKELFDKATLDGCELSRAITVSWKLKEMAISEFIPYIQTQMAEEMGAALGYGATHGAGAADPNKPEPVGTVTALEAEENTPQVVSYTAGALAYADITKARSKVKSGYAGGIALYANSNTIWNEVANVKDENGRPIFVADPISGGAYKVLGCPVREDDSMQDGEILFSNASKGYTANINKQITVSTEEHIKDRVTDYCGYAIVDGNVMSTKAHALLKYAVGE